MPSALSLCAIDNISAREKIRYRSVLRLRYDTTLEQLQLILEGIRHLLSSHERVLQDNPRVRFTEIADDALLVEVDEKTGRAVGAEAIRAPDFSKVKKG